MIVEPGRGVALLLIVLLIAFAAVPLVAETYYLKLATRMLVMAIFAISLDLLIGYGGLVSLGHAAFFGLAAYVVQIASPEYSAANGWLVLPLALAVTAAAAAAVGALAVRTRGIYFIMVTLAFAQMFFYFFHDSAIAGGSDGAFIFVKPSFPLPGGMTLDLENRTAFYYLTLAGLAASYLLLLVILRAPFGRALRGIRVNESRMRALGYDSYRFKLVSFVAAGTLAGFAGFLFACIDGFVSPALLGWHQSGTVIMMVLLGGLGTLYGPILGAFLFIAAEEVAREPALVGAMADHWLLLMGGFIVAAVLLLPDGVAGLLRRRGAAGAEP